MKYLRSELSFALCPALSTIFSLLDDLLPAASSQPREEPVDGAGGKYHVMNDACKRFANGTIIAGGRQELRNARPRHQQSIAAVIVVLDDGQQDPVAEATSIKLDGGDQAALDLLDSRKRQRSRLPATNAGQRDVIVEFGMAWALGECCLEGVQG